MKRQWKQGDGTFEEALNSEVVAEAHITEVALKLFQFADNADRDAKFGKWESQLYVQDILKIEILYQDEVNVVLL